MRLSFRAHWIVQKVIIRQADAILQLGLVGPAEGCSLAHIQQLARGAVRAGGVPFDVAFVANNLGDQFGELLDGQLLPRSGVYGLVAAVVVHQEDAEVGEVVDIEELAQRRAVAPASHLLQPVDLGFVKAADQRGQYMAMLGVVVVVGAIKVSRHHADVVGAILTVQKLAILQATDLRQGIGFVGLLELACE